MRDDYYKGYNAVVHMKWSVAKERFSKVLDRKPENEWSWRAKRGLKEIEAGKLYAEAARALRANRIPKAKDLLAKVRAIKEATHYRKLARELARKL
jgi:outer membrane protein assembly factor BamD (BamD/ComL family)